MSYMAEKMLLSPKVFDMNQDGFVTKDEMLKLCKNLNKEQVTNFHNHSGHQI